MFKPVGFVELLKSFQDETTEEGRMNEIFSIIAIIITSQIIFFYPYTLSLSIVWSLPLLSSIESIISFTRRAFRGSEVEYFIDNTNSLNFYENFSSCCRKVFFFLVFVFFRRKLFLRRLSTFLIKVLFLTSHRNFLYIVYLTFFDEKFSKLGIFWFKRFL